MKRTLTPLALVVLVCVATVVLTRRSPPPAAGPAPSVTDRLAAFVAEQCEASDQAVTEYVLQVKGLACGVIQTMLIGMGCGFR